MEGLRVVGAPSELANRYYEQGIDEIIFMDTVASLYGRNTIFETVQEAAKDVFVPLSAGGGIRTVDDIRIMLRAGADKVAINTEALKRPEFLSEAANIFGSQCVLLSVEAKKQPAGGWEAYVENGRERTGKDVIEWVQEAEKLGAGEILLTSVDQEGTKKGFDQDLIREVHKRVRIPVIAAGGAGACQDVIDILPNVDAVSCASILHYDICPLPQLKQAVQDAGLLVRV